MIASKNDISTLISIISIKFPTEYPKKESIDELDSFLPAINFPSYSKSNINSFSSIFQTKNTFKDIIENIHFYFPFVPTVLQIISKYNQDTTDEILDICACIVMCSYISWRAFCEYTRNFEHLPLILDCIPFVSKSNYIDLITDVYCDSLNFYLDQCSSFNFNSIFNSMTLLLEKESIQILSKMQSIFYTIISKKFFVQNNSEISNECQNFMSYLCQTTDLFPDIFEKQTAKEVILLLTNQIESIEINSLHLFANLIQKIDKEVAIPIFSILPVSFYKYITSMQHPFEISEHSTEYAFHDIQFSSKNDSNKITKQKLNSDDFSDSTFIEGTFSDELPQRPFFTIDRKYPNGLLLNEKTCEILMYIAKAAQQSIECRDIIIKDFNSFIIQKENKYHNILLYSLIFIVSNLNLNTKQSRAYWNILLTSDVFNNDFNAFDFDNPNDFINQIRGEAIDSMISSGFLNVHIFLTNITKNQLLLSETFHRMYRNFSEISKIEFFSTDFLYFLVQCSNFFQKLNIIEEDQENLKIIKSTRVCLLLLISQGLTIDEVSIFWFSISYFSDFFSSLIFENILCNYVIGHYQRYLFDIFHQTNQTFISGIKRLFKILFQTNIIPTEKSFLISIDFAHMLNSILTEKSESAETYSEIINIIIESLSNIDFKSDESHIYLIQVLQIMSFIHLNDHHFLILKEAIKKINQEKFGQQIKKELLKLASGNQCLSEIIPLQQPKVVSIILELFGNENEKMIKYLTDEIQPLLSKSIYNCIQAFKYGIEENLIIKLKELQKEKPLNINISSQVLNSLTTINSIKASMSSVHHFIELISPIDCKHISALSPYLLQSLSTIFTNYTKIPHYFLSFSSRLDISNVDSSIFHKSFEIAIWCFIEPYQLKNTLIQVCSILDSKGKGIRISILDNKKIIITYIRKHEETLEFDANFPLGKWHLIRFKFIIEQVSNISRQSSQSSMEAFSFRSNSSFTKMKNGSKSFNNSDYMPLSLFGSAPIQSPSNSTTSSSTNAGFGSNQSFSPQKKSSFSFNFSLSPSSSTIIPHFIDFSSGISSGFGSKSKQSIPNVPASVSIVIDGNETEIKDMNLRRFNDQTVSVKIGLATENVPICYFSCFSVFPYNKYDTDANFYDWENETAQIISANFPLLTVNFEENEGHLRPVCSTNEASIEQSSNSIKEVPSSMAHIFIHKAKIHSLILLFAEFDFLSYEQEKVLAFSDFTVEMILAFIQCGKEAQISFYENKCTEAIAHLLSLCNPTNLNFSIYLQITALLNLISIPGLKLKFFFLIVLNFDIWGRAETEVLRLITQHWAQNLFLNYQEEMMKVISIPFLLFIMSEHYENEKIMNNLCNLFLKIADIEFTSQNFLNLIEYCTMNKDPNIVDSYLGVLKKTLSSRKESDNVISHNIQFISLLHNLLELNNDTIFCSVIEIIMICHRKLFFKSKSFTLLQHIRMIMSKITPGVCTMNSLKSIIKMTNSTNPELYPLYSLIALNCGKEAIEYLSEAIKPSKSLVNSSERLFWIILLLCSIKDIDKQKSFCFLFNNNYARIKETCILVQLISIVCDRISDQQLDSFLSLEFALISEHPENFQADFVHKILKIAYNALLFRPKYAISEWMRKVVDNSPYNDQNPSNSSSETSPFNDESTKKENEILKPDDIYRKIGELSSSSKKVAFQLCPRLDENGNWSDSSLSYQCLKLFELYFNPSLLTYDLILCAFIFHVNPQLARTHLQRINISNYASKISMNLLSFIFFSGESKGIDLSMISCFKQNFSKLASFNFLQEFSEQTKPETFGTDMAKMASEVVSWSDQNRKIERNFTNFANLNYNLMKEMNICITNEIKSCRMKQRFRILHVWQQMWNEMARFKGRWNSAKYSATVKNHYKRSSRFICNDFANCYYPLKMALNNEFYNCHIDASIARDVGSIKEAKQKDDIYQSKHKLYGIVFSTLRPSISNSTSNYYEHISSSSFLYEKYIKSNPAFRKEAVLIKPEGCYEGFFEVFFDAFVINRKPILFSDIREISLKRRLHRPTAFEIFKKNGKSYLIDIPNYHNSNLMKYFLPFMTSTTINDYTEKWANYEISTFEYLMKLNELSGRTFNDLSAYPVMPWILAEYNTDIIDLEDPKYFRDLSKPMGALNEERLQMLKVNSVNTGESIPVHLYSNGYISPLIVLSYLVRIEPFTTMHINYHSGRFEPITKIFKSISQAYKNATNIRSDFMELIPEFFSTPEFLLNKENFDLTGPDTKKAPIDTSKVSSNENGKNNGLNLDSHANYIIPDSNSLDQITPENSSSSTDINFVASKDTNCTKNEEKSLLKSQSKIELSKQKYPGYVDLPSWALNSSSVFVYINRKALESNYVSMNIHKWIDLIWGYKQTGPEAEKADNTFYPLMYSDVWTRLEKKEINISPKHIETVLSEVGQIPIQLFKKPHPQRQSPSTKNSRIYQHNLIKNEETIMFGVNQILLSSFQTAKIDENANLNSGGSGGIGSSSGGSTKFNLKTNQKLQKQRESYVSGIVIDSSSKVICLSIKGKSVSTVCNESVEKLTSFITNTSFDKLCSFGECVSSSSLICPSSDRHFFFLFKPFEKAMLKSGRLNYAIKHACINEEVVATCGENLTSIWSANNLSKPLFTLPTYRDDIECVAVSAKFDMFVCGTSDGFIQFNSIHDRRSLQIVEIGDTVPRIIKITPAWGFVVVYAISTTINSNSKSSNFIILFSPNGTKIRQTELPPGEVLSAIEIYRSKDGFDFAFVATESGNIYHFEVFFAKFDKPFYNAPFYINSISYIAEQSVIYCSGKDNSILVVPFYP